MTFATARWSQDRYFAHVAGHNIEFSCAAESPTRSFPPDSLRLYHGSIVHFRRQLQRFVMKPPACSPSSRIETPHASAAARAMDGEGVGSDSIPAGQGPASHLGGRSASCLRVPYRGVQESPHALLPARVVAYERRLSGGGLQSSRELKHAEADLSCLHR